MPKRQKILLALMGLTIAVALYMQFGTSAGPAKPGAVAVPGAPGSAADNLRQLLELASGSDVELYKLGLLADNGTSNPFYEGKGVLTIEEDRSLAGSEADPVYSGFIRAGNKAFAVLDGIEYTTGDTLADSAYRVQGIEKDSVVLERIDPTTGRKLTRRVPLVEDVADKIRVRVVKRR
jgi:hypothetical protein